MTERTFRITRRAVSLATLVFSILLVIYLQIHL